MSVQFRLPLPDYYERSKMIKVIPICPDHDEELRQEYLVDEEDHGYMSGFCFKCAKHYRLCTKTHYMTHCIKKQDHEGDHLDGQGTTWKQDWRPY
jgi:hypothetical protein